MLLVRKLFWGKAAAVMLELMRIAEIVSLFCHERWLEVVEAAKDIE